MGMQGWGAPVSAKKAERAVAGWLRINGREVGKSSVIAGKTASFSDANGQTAWYVVYTEPEGYLIVPADDEVEPIIAIIERGTFDPSPEKPLGAIVSRDIPDHVRTVGEDIKVILRSEAGCLHPGALGAA